MRPVPASTLGGRCCHLGRLDLPCVRGDPLLGALVDQVGQRPGAAAEQQERQHRNARQERHHAHHGARHAERLGIAGELRNQGLVGGARDAGLGDEQTGGGRHDQRRHLRDQSVADSEQRVGARGVGKRHALLGDADDCAADDVDEHDQQARDGVAAYEFRGAVHGPVEAGFVLERLPAPPRLALVDHPGGQVGVDRHLLARHGVEVEARRHFRDAAGALGDHHEIHDHQDREHDDADHEVAAHHEIAERLDDVAGSRGALVPARQNEAGRGEIERQPQHRGDQQHGREGGEFERRLDEQRRHQDQHREDDRNGKCHVKKRRRQRQDEDDQDRHHADRQRDVAALEYCPEIAELRHGEPACRLPACRTITHVFCRRPPRPIVGMKGLRRGREAADPRERNRARVQGPPRVRRVSGRCSPAKFAQLMVSG